MRKRGWTTALAALCLSLSACGHKAAPEGPGPDTKSAAAPFPGKPTPALIQRPEVAALVDALAKEKTLESSHIGAAGAPSEVYAKFVAVRKAATEAEMVALLQHESPVVRGYAAQHVAREMPAHLGALVPLAEDATVVPTLEGCMGGSDVIGAVVQNALCYSPLPEAGGTLLAIAEKGGMMAAEALECAAPSAPVVAAERVAKALQGPVKPRAEVAYLRVLGVAATADPKEGCALARARGASDDASVQIAVAQALWRCDDEASRAILEKLASGKNTVVARHAKASLFLSVPARRTLLATDMEVTREAVERLGKVLRSAEGTKGAIALVEELALANPMRMGGVFERAVVLPETTQAALRIAAKTEPSVTRIWGSVRADVIRYLGRAKDPAAKAELRRSLGAGDPFELVGALQGIAALKDSASRAEVEKLTKHLDSQVAKAAAEALAAL